MRSIFWRRAANARAILPSTLSVEYRGPGVDDMLHHFPSKRCQRHEAAGTISDIVAFDKQVGIPGALDTFTTITSTRWDPKDPALAGWYDRLKKAYPNDEPSPYAMYGLGGAQVLVEALRLAGPDLTREKFLTALGSLKDFKSDAYYGPITCHDPVSHQCNQSVGWMSFKNGTTTEVQ